MFASATRDVVEPATAHIVQAELGSRAHALDVTNACNSADCLPRPGWTAGARGALGRGAGLVFGRIDARRDEHGPLGRAAFRALVRVAAFFGRIRPAHHRRHGYLAPYRMHAGNNMAITAALYEAVGGMPRRPSPTDRLFLNRVRRHTTAIVHVGFGEPVGRDQQCGVLGDVVRWQGAQGGSLVQVEFAVLDASETSVGADVGGGVQGQEPCCGAQLLLAELPVTHRLLGPAGDP